MSDLINTTHELLENGHRGVFNVVGDERLSKHAFGCKLANIFDYDITLINSGRLKDMKALTTRPYDMSMSNEKVTRLLGRSIGNIDAQLVRLKQEENLTRVRAIHEIDSLR
jgi:dTDP-4-dehydrorhamnose reductase